MVALGIIGSEFSNSSIQCDVYIFQLTCLSPSYDHFFAANNEYLPLTSVVILKATQGLDCIKQFERA